MLRICRHIGGSTICLLFPVQCQKVEGPSENYYWRKKLGTTQSINYSFQGSRSTKPKSLMRSFSHLILTFEFFWHLVLYCSEFYQDVKTDMHNIHFRFLPVSDANGRLQLIVKHVLSPQSMSDCVKDLSKMSSPTSALSPLLKTSDKFRFR